MTTIFHTKSNQKRALILIVFIFLTLLIPFIVTSGKTFEENSMRQNSRISIENITVGQGKIHYTLHNKSWRKINLKTRDPILEKKIDGTFSPLPLDGNDLGEMNPSIAMECAPFGKLDGWITKNSSTLTAGEYRLYYRYGDGSLYAVGYFTVAE